MGGGAHAPGFPHPHPTQSYWQLPPHPLATHRTTPSLPTTTLFDYIIIGSGIIGSGITGAATAHKLLEARAAPRGC
ncbi:hypothetical protein MMC26_000038 [Xylographa opegraphella]|nr:hypothetical protein [Xylographa opegraphella]